MATQTVPATAVCPTITPGAGKRTRRFYTPGPWVRVAPGVRYIAGERCSDFYFGSAEALSAAGLLPIELFPGRPGVGVCSATYWPEGTVGRGSMSTPGRLMVKARPGGTFAITLAVPEDEQRRREVIFRQKQDKENRERQQARQRELKAAESSVTRVDLEAVSRALLTIVMKDLGAAWLRREAERMCSAQQASEPKDRSHLRQVWAAPSDQVQSPAPGEPTARPALCLVQS